MSFPQNGNLPAPPLCGFPVSQANCYSFLLSVAANSYAQAYAEKLGYTYTVRGTTDAAQLETMVTELSIIPVDDELEEFQVLFLSELDDSNS